MSPAHHHQNQVCLSSLETILLFPVSEVIDRECCLRSVQLGRLRLSGHAVRFPAQHIQHHWAEVVQGQGIVGRVKGLLVPLAAEVAAVLIVRVVLETVAQVLVDVASLSVVVGLAEVNRRVEYVQVLVHRVS